MIRTVIIDDELKSQSTLQKLLEKYCTGVEVVGFANSVKTGVAVIENNNPDLVFLDIAMPDGDGFDVLKKVTHRNFEVVFTTAFNDYAIKAFQFSALHYLLKPINYIELQQAVQRFKENRKSPDMAEQFQILFDSLKEKHKKIALPTSNGLKVVEVSNIVYCRADSSYTSFYFTDKEVIVVSKSLSNFEDILPSDIFCRVHNKYLVNLNFVTSFIKGRNGRITLSNGLEIDVSESKKSDFFDRLKRLAHFLPDFKK